jgi:hypothetical protein
MSAYALPGLFFPPPLPTCNDAELKPCRYMDLTSSFINFSSLVGDNTTQIEPVEDVNATSSDSDGVAQVVVKSAKVDIMQLVNSSARPDRLSASNSGNTTTTYKGPIRAFLAGRRERRRRILQRLRSSWTSSTSVDEGESSSSNEKPVSSPNQQERAIHFDLSVSYHDRKYDSVRSLARIRQLYNELVDGETFDPDDEEDEEINNSEPCESSVPYQRRSTSKQNIPDLPEMFDDSECATASNFRSLYGNLHQYYAPALESWFQSLFTVITPKTNSVLAYFLCEPTMLLKGDGYDQQHQQSSKNSKVSKRSSSRLEMIVEEERFEDDESIM